LIPFSVILRKFRGSWQKIEFVQSIFNPYNSPDRMLWSRPEVAGSKLKLEKAKKLGIPQLSEAELLEWVSPNA
jgi:hypothetical protein